MVGPVIGTGASLPGPARGARPVDFVREHKKQLVLGGVASAAVGALLALRMLQPGARHAPTATLAAAGNAVVEIRGLRSGNPLMPFAGVGSGWIAAKDTVITNNHVVEATSFLTVSTPGRLLPRRARVLARDPQRDVAVLQVKGVGRPLEMTADHPTGKDYTLAGYPGGYWRRFIPVEIRDDFGPFSFDSKFGRLTQGRMHAYAVPGNSGGPVLDSDGKVVATASAKFSDETFSGVLNEDVAAVLAASRAH